MFAPRQAIFLHLTCQLSSSLRLLEAWQGQDNALEDRPKRSCEECSEIWGLLRFAGVCMAVRPLPSRQMRGRKWRWAQSPASSPIVLLVAESELPTVVEVPERIYVHGLQLREVAGAHVVDAAGQPLNGLLLLRGAGRGSKRPAGRPAPAGWRRWRGSRGLCANAPPLGWHARLSCDGRRLHFRSARGSDC